MPESSFYHISPKGTLACVATLDEAVAAHKNGGFTWLDYRQPTKNELSVLTGSLGIHPLSIEDCIDKNQVPKIEDFPGSSFIIVNAFSYADRKLSVDEVDIFIGEKFLITVSGYDSGARRPLNDIQRIVELNIERAQQGPAFLMHIILDHIVDQKFVTIEAVEDGLEAAEEAMLAAPASFNPGEMLRLRKELLALRKSLFHEREILGKICRKDCPFISDKAILHYRDIYDHVTKFFELTEGYRDVVTSLMELHTTMLSNLMAKTSNETNAAVRRLTFITTIFMPLTLLAGIGGMSEWSMMTGPQNWRIAYPAFLLAMAVIGIANYYLMKRVEH
jgi:magnesium transporter